MSRTITIELSPRWDEKGFMNENRDIQDSIERAPYHSPTVQVRSLTLITRGGSPTSGDSGNTSSGDPLPGQSTRPYEPDKKG